MSRFRKKPIVIEAILNTGEWIPIRDWVSAHGPDFTPDPVPPITRNSDGSLNIRTLEGTMRADVGDYVIRGVKGELYPIKADIFAATYEAVGEP